jgi:quercetin dioxygenase-like cupin family protein
MLRARRSLISCHVYVAVSCAAGTGPATWAMGMLFERLVGVEETAGLLGASVVTQPPGQASPLHVHTREAEAWFLLQGAMTYRAGEQLIRMTAGDVRNAEWIEK